MVRYITEFSRSLWLLRAPIIVVLLFAFLMQQPQIQEIYSIFISNAQDLKLRTPVLALLSMLALCLALWAVGRDLSLADSRETPSNAVNEPGAKGHILRNMPALIACLPLVLTTLGMLEYSGTLGKSFVQDTAIVQEASEQSASAPAAPVTQKGLAQTLSENSGGLRENFSDLLGVALDWTDDAKSMISYLDTSVYALAALTVAFAIFVFWRANFSIVTDIRIMKKSVATIVAVVFLACVAVAAGQSASTGMDFTSIPRSVGAIFVINLFLICLCVSLAVLTRLNDVQGIPALTFILVAGLIGTSNNWNDNHALRVMPVEPKPMSSRAAEIRARPEEYTKHPNARPLPVAFLDWFESRPQARRDMFAPDGMQNPGDPSSEIRKYPVYIVAAQGGGLYASYLTAITLARMYDQCPALRHHIFAISGVSGGSVGAGLVSALLQLEEAKPNKADDASCTDRAPLLAGEKEEPGELEKRVVDYFAGDLLSPLTATALFADLPQRALPFNIPNVSEHFDRSRAFEAGLETQWEALINKWEKDLKPAPNPFRAAFRDHWRAEGDGPMLVLNVTAVNSGQQVLAAPFVTDRNLFLQVNNSALHSMYQAVIGDKEDMRLSTAMGLSARFPVALSAASKKVSGTAVRFGDGGYYENSGVDTALSMVRDLKFYKDNMKVVRRTGDAALDPKAYANIEFRLIILNEYYRTDLAAGGFHEILSPLLGLYNTRTHRGRLAIDRALASGAPVHMVRLVHGVFPLPLGWQFGETTSKGIRNQLGTARECRGSQQFKKRMRALQVYLSKQAKPASPGGTARVVSTLDQLPVLARILEENRCSQRDVIRAIQPGGQPDPS